MSQNIEDVKREINIRKQNLRTKRLMQNAENDKEAEMLTLWENSIESLKEEK